MYLWNYFLHLMEPIIHILPYHLKSALVLMYCGSDVAFEHVRRDQSNFNLFHFFLRDCAFGVFRVGFPFEFYVGPHKERSYSIRRVTGAKSRRWINGNGSILPEQISNREVKSLKYDYSERGQNYLLKCQCFTNLSYFDPWARFGSDLLISCKRSWKRAHSMLTRGKGNDCARKLRHQACMSRHFLLEYNLLLSRKS